MKYAISSCLMGVNCKYSGGNNRNAVLCAFMKDKEYLLVCPEVLGGLPTPRACSEIVDDRVMNTCGEDVTRQFEEGARIAYEKILAFGADIVITQSRSPSCGKDIIYDGTFCGHLKPGNGKFVQLLMQKGIPAMDIEEFLQNIIDAK